jgi:hypothetical protein
MWFSDIDSTDYLTVKYDSSGIRKWVRTYNGIGQRLDFSNAITVTDSGNAYITGHSKAINGANDYATIKYDSSGVQKWVLFYNGLANNADVAFSVAADSLGNVYITGFGLETMPFDRQIVTIKYSYTTGITEPDNNYSISFYPNPFSSFAHLTVNPSIKNGELKIFNLLGSEVRHMQLKSSPATIHHDNLPAGIYFYRIISNHQVIANGKMVIN